MTCIFSHDRFNRFIKINRRKQKSVVMRIRIILLLAIGFVNSTGTEVKDKKEVFIPTKEWKDINEGNDDGVIHEKRITLILNV